MAGNLVARMSLDKDIFLNCLEIKTPIHESDEVWISGEEDVNVRLYFNILYCESDAE